MSEDHQGPEGERLEREGGKLIHKGPIVSVRMDRFRYPDGSTDVRQVVVHPGSVAIVAYDARSVYLVRQPREPVEEAALLELPAGRLDKEGESPLEAAQRELREEIGKSAGDWTELRRFYTSPGFASERVHLFMATELYDVPAEPEDDEMIDIIKLPLERARLDDRGLPRREVDHRADRPARPPRQPLLAAPGAAGQGWRPRTSNNSGMATMAPPTDAAVRPTPRFEALVLDYLAHLEFERGLSRNTLSAYRTDLLQFGRFLAERGKDATDADGPGPLRLPGRAWRPATGTGRRRCSTATVHRKAACLRSFYRHLRREDLIADDPAAKLPTPRRGKKLPEVLSYSEVQKLLAQPRGDEKTVSRDRALLELMYASGLRASETIGLELSDIDIESGVLRARGKGSKERLVPVGDKALAAVRMYLRSGRPELVGDQRRAQALRQLPRRGADPPGPLQDRPAPRRDRRPEGADEPPHAAPLLRHPPALRRLRPALGPGDARPRRPLDHPALHPPLGRGAEGGYFKAHPRACE